MGFCAAVRVRAQFSERSTGKQSDETVLAISSLMPLADPRANTKSLPDPARAEGLRDQFLHCGLKTATPGRGINSELRLAVD